MRAGLRDVRGLDFERIAITDSPSDGVRLSAAEGRAIADVTFASVRIDNPGVLVGGGYGFYVAPGVVGTATVRDSTVTHPGTASTLNASAHFNLVRQ